MRYAVGFALLLAACAPVREDRTIEWSSDGTTVGFQHGRDGIYVADKNGATLERVFVPDKNVAAASTPLWAPNDGRLIFATAQIEGEKEWLRWNHHDPAGAMYAQAPATYTCWLRGAAGDGPAPKPVSLFRARCDHVGYIAANLAVRWHPGGRKVLYLDRVGEKRHSVFAYDLSTRRSQRCCSLAARAMLFDFAPDGSLVCLLDDGDRTGIYIGGGEGSEWWRVPDTRLLPVPERGSPIESLRAARPAWTPDGGRFAFTVRESGKVHALRVCDRGTRSIRTVATSKRLFRDLRWSPDGRRLGVVEGDAVRVLDETGVLRGPVSSRPVRLFAGWNHTGERMAYVVPDKLPYGTKTVWSLLLIPDPMARDVVIVDGREAVSGMRATFPRWSPCEDKLSVWFTFSPSVLSPLAMILRTGLLPGDPAAVFSPDTGAVDWLAVNSFEREQIGHIKLLKGDAKAAWEWYQRARRDRRPPPREPIGLTSLFFEQPRVDDLALFESVCLRELGRAKEADARLREFERRFSVVDDMLEPSGLAMHLLRDLHVAQVFLALDRADAAASHFRSRVDDRDELRALSARVVLCQILLLQARFEEFAAMAASAVEAWSRAHWVVEQNSFVGALVYDAVLLGFAPLLSKPFLERLSDDTVRGLLPVWQKLRENPKRNTVDLAAYLGLERCHQRLGSRVHLGPRPANQAILMMLDLERVDEWFAESRPR